MEETQKSEFCSMEEIEKEYYPNTHAKKKKVGENREPGEFGIWLATEVLDDAKNKLNP